MPETNEHLQTLQARYQQPCAGILDEIQAAGFVAGTIIDIVSQYIFEFATDALVKQRPAIIQAAKDATEWAIAQFEASTGITVSLSVRAMASMLVENAVTKIIDAAIKQLPA